jgi:hypothetical protein
MKMRWKASEFDLTVLFYVLFWCYELKNFKISVLLVKPSTLVTNNQNRPLETIPNFENSDWTYQCMWANESNSE